MKKKTTKSPKTISAQQKFVNRQFHGELKKGLKKGLEKAKEAGESQEHLTAIEALMNLALRSSED
jgi:hypothetical protein